MISPDEAPIEEQPEVDLDALFSGTFDAEAAQDILRRAAPKQGTYTTNPAEYPVSVRGARVVSKDDDGNIVDERTVATIVARAEGKFGQKIEQTTVRFDISPEARKAREYIDGEATGELLEKDDLRTKLWAQAARAFRESVGQDPTDNRQVLTYLETVPFKVFVFVTPDGKAIVTSVSPVRRKKGG